MRILSASGDARSSSTAEAAPVGARLDSFAPAAVSGAASRGATRRTRVPLSGRAVDVQAAAEQRQPLADAEQPPAHLAGLRSIVQSRRLEPSPSIRHGDAQLIVGIELQRQRHAIRLRVFDRVEEQLSDRLEEQRADILPRGIRARIGADLDTQLVLLVRPVRQPRQGGGQSGTLQHGRKQLDVQRPRDGDRFVELLLRLCQQLARRRANLGLPLQLLFEVQRHDDQELLEPIVQRPGDLLARMVLGERQVPRHLTQLRRPVFQFGRALLKGRRGTLAFGDVGHERECASAARRRHVIDGDFDRKRGSVLARADEVQAARGVRAVANRSMGSGARSAGRSARRRPSRTSPRPHDSQRRASRARPPTRCPAWRSRAAFAACDRVPRRDAPGARPPSCGAR